ncbi:MAG: hypothetical protein ACQERJ_04645, partial [Bacillota bacterium]
LLLCLMVVITACNEVGNLRINVYDKQQNLINDAYVGLYTKDFKQRIAFRYTTRGEVQFEGLKNKAYGVKIIKHNLKKKLKVSVKGGESNYIKIDLK